MSTVLRVTAVDVETGEEQTVDLSAGDYLLLATAPCRQAHVQAYSNGTHVITVKGHSAGSSVMSEARHPVADLDWHAVADADDYVDSVPQVPNFGEHITPSVIALNNGDALRAYLDWLNQSGVHPSVVGWTAAPHPMPFFVTLTDQGDSCGVEIVMDSPWASDRDWGNPARCEECRAHDTGPDDLDGLRYPVTIMAATTHQNGSEGTRR